MESVRVRLLGPLEVSRLVQDTWQIVEKKEWGAGTPARSVFKRLLTSPARRLARGDIQDALWPTGSVELADRYLNNATAILRKIIGHELVETIGPLYQISDQAHVWTDLDACIHLVREAERQGCTTRQAVSLLEEAHRYFTRGICLEDESEQWYHAVRANTERVQRQCLTWLAEAYESQGLFFQAGEIYHEMARAWNEEALHKWMSMLARAGQPEEARRCYQDTKAAWDAQGMALSEQTHTLAREIAHTSEAITLALPSRPLAEIQLVPRQETTLTLTDDLYDGLEVEILALVLRWRLAAGPVPLLQRLVMEKIQKHDTMHDKDHHETHITRRHALQAIALLPIQLYGLSHLPPTRPVPLDEMLAGCAAGITSCWELRQYEPEGLQAIQRILSAYLPTLEHLARQASPFQQDAAHLAAQGYLLVGILANHYSQIEQMAEASRRAYKYSKVARDPNLQTSALIRLAVAYDFEELDSKTLQTYQQALALPDFDSVTPLLRGRVYAGLAGMYGYSQQIDQALSYLSQATEIFPDDPASDPSHPFAICDVNSLVLWQGLTLQYTGRYKEAETVFTRVGSLTPLPGILETHRAENLNYAAMLAIQQRDLDAATCYLDTADTIAWEIRHSHLQEEARATLKSMHLVWPQETQVRQLQAQMDSRQHA